MGKAKNKIGWFFIKERTHPSKVLEEEEASSPFKIIKLVLCYDFCFLSDVKVGEIL